jgi:hypothetical protein
MESERGHELTGPLLVNPIRAVERPTFVSSQTLEIENRDITIIDADESIFNTKCDGVIATWVTLQQRPFSKPTAGGDAGKADGLAFARAAGQFYKTFDLNQAKSLQLKACRRNPSELA